MNTTRILLVCLLVSSFLCSAQSHKKSNEIRTYNGNKFELQTRANDTVVSTEADGSEVMRIIAHDPVPVKMNNKKIYQTDELTSKPANLPGSQPLDEYLVKGIGKLWDSLPNGQYHLGVYSIVADAAGKIVFYTSTSCSGFSLNSPHPWIGVPRDMEKAISNKVKILIDKAPVLKPGKLNSRNVICLTDIYTYSYLVVVLDHKTTISKEKK